MSDTLKFELKFLDRLGIVCDVAHLMTDQGLNIVTMELQQKHGFATISLEIEKTDLKIDKNILLDLFSTLPGIKKWQKLKWLPQEKRQQWFRTLFDGMSEGIISVDSTGNINTINSVACRILDQVYENTIGKHISELSPKDSILVDCLRKKIPVSRRKSLVTSRGRVEFYGSAKPISDSNGRLVGAVLLIQDLKEVKEMVDAVSTPLQVTFDDFIGQSPVIRNLITFARKIADTGTIISINGDSGTGKELFARAIHFESGQPGPFIPINCAAIPESLIESELFGYAEGAFTGARENGKPGLFGGYEEIPVNARVITATNMNLKEMILEKRFREDLFYRINGFTLQIPPLRERLMDIPLLAAYLLHQFNVRLARGDQVISKSGFTKLYQYSWPGNVRELKNVIERASILCDSDVIGVESILLGNERTAGEAHSLGGEPLKNSKNPLKFLVGQYEMGIVLETLNQTKSIRQAARQLGLSHTALLKKISKYNLQNVNNRNRWKQHGPPSSDTC